MLKLGSTYLKTKNMEKSIKFYSTLLNMKPSSQNYDRWAQFDFGGQCIALFNPDYDDRRISSDENLEGVYSQNYIEYIRHENIKYGNNMVLNFYIEDLKEEYERLQTLNIGEITQIMYMNIAMPYYSFVLIDPDGNEIEIAGEYKE
ncbi:VOC family protein [Helicovermis profundi]|uniref:VOC domain-containing protein n=1 Tax=Helicovermis profundi TaxID=3065157 RepID=A0AAU9E0S9_9FIRM|nr:hypothetical protein HLPR_01640 [Clostridia bacterium S502]